jgi:putative tryptophan/tyrosine transport system substrate-binding protein
MRRREFIVFLCAPGLMWTVGAHGQQRPVRVIGFLSGESLQQDGVRLASLRQGLKEGGYVEGHNLAIEYRGAEGTSERIPALAANLIKAAVSLIVVAGVPVALAAKTVTTTVPIVFTIAGDPVELGIVASLQRPGGNITGVSTLTSTAVVKQLEVLHEIVPVAVPIGFLINPTTPLAQVEVRHMQGAAQALGRELLILSATKESDLEQAFASLARGGAGAVAIGSNPLFNSRPAQLAALAAGRALPAVAGPREFAVVGGLLSYGSSVAEAYRLTGQHVARVLNGEKPEELPVIQATKLQLIINLKTAKQLGLTIPPTLLARADELIE